MNELVEASFRRESARLIAGLTRAFGAQRLELAEDVVQETFLRALRTWPAHGIPHNPGAWLGRVARNLAVDRLRREGLYASDDALEFMPVEPDEPALVDDELGMLLLCCHPSLPSESQIALTLRTVCGLGVSEIAKALLAGEEAIARRISRAKVALGESGAEFEMPSQVDASARLNTVRTVLYLLFNEGYAAHQGPQLTNSELCDEAILLTSRLAASRLGADPATHALLALMLLHSSRLPARLDADGGLCLLEDQDRSLWDRSRIGAGLDLLVRSADGDRLTPYHCEAAIAACHATAPTFEATDWPEVLRHYDDLVRLNPGAVARLNRAVAVAMVHGAEAGLREVDRLAEEPRLRGYYLLPATRARLLHRLGRTAEATAAYRAAQALARNPAEAAFLAGRIASVERLG